MRIGIDILVLQSVAKQRGVGRYVQSLVEGLKRHDNHEYFLLYNKNVSLPADVVALCAGVNLIGLEFSSLQNQKELLTNTSISNRRLSLSDVRDLKSCNLDVLHLTSPMEYSPLVSREISGIPVVATVYDFIPLIFPEHYLLTFDSKQNYLAGLNLLLKSNRWLCISQSTSRDMVQLLGVPEEYIDLIHLGPGDYLARSTGSASSHDLRRIGLKRPFIMSVTSVHWAKNLRNLIVAYSQIPADLRSDIQLVIVCNLSKYHESLLREWAFVHQLKESEIIFSGEISDDDLAVLFQQARILVHPSIYEGFGLPVLEAMYAGVPVITSNTSSMVELADGAAILVDPFEVSEISRAMIFLLMNDSERSDLIGKGRERSSNFSWARCVSETLAIYAQASRADVCV